LILDLRSNNDGGDGDLVDSAIDGNDASIGECVVVVKESAGASSLSYVINSYQYDI
jgi:hypothetical protein